MLLPKLIREKKANKILKIAKKNSFSENSSAGLPSNYLPRFPGLILKVLPMKSKKITAR